MKPFFFCLFMALAVTCRKPEDGVMTDGNGVVTQLPHFWKSSISPDGVRVNLMYGQQVYAEKYVLAAKKEDYSDPEQRKEYFCLKNTENGQEKWLWQDRFHGFEGRLAFKYQFHQFQNYLLYNYGPRSYCINLESGQTVWKKEWTPGISSVITTTGFGSSFFFTGTPPELDAQKRFEEAIYQGDMATGIIQLVAKPTVLPGKAWNDPSGYKLISRGRRITPFVKNADTLLLVSYDLPDPRPQFTTTSSGYLSLYNLSQKKWVYEQMPLVNPDEAGGGNWPVLLGDKVYYAINMWVGCFEVFTGKRVWMKRLTQASLFGDMILAEGKLLANGQDAKLYCLDPQTGNVLWTQKSSGIGSSLHYQDGVVYYIASKNLLATDVATGKLLWDLPCPDYRTEGRGDSWFAGFVTGLPGKNGEKGRIFASTNLNVYCFEAAR